MACEFLWVSADKREGHWVVELEKVGEARKQLYGFVGVAEGRFSDGSSKWAWFCRNSCRKPTHYDQLLAGTREIDQPSEWWTHPERCECAERLLPHLGGIEGVKQLLEESHRSLETEAASLVVPLDEGGGSAVRAGPDFEHWGVVHKASRCQSCSRGSDCGHRSGQGAQVAAERLSDALAELKLGNVFNFSKGCRKIQGRMTARKLPRHIRTVPLLHDIAQGLCHHSLLSRGLKW